MSSSWGRIVLVYVYWVLGLQLIYYQLSKLGPHLVTFQDKFGKHILNTSLTDFPQGYWKIIPLDPGDLRNQMQKFPEVRISEQWFPGDLTTKRALSRMAWCSNLKITNAYSMDIIPLKIGWYKSLFLTLCFQGHQLEDAGLICQWRREDRRISSCIESSPLIIYHKL